MSPYPAQRGWMHTPAGACSRSCIPTHVPLTACATACIYVILGKSLDTCTPMCESTPVTVGWVTLTIQPSGLGGEGWMGHLGKGTARGQQVTWDGGTFGRALRARREGAGFSQRELATTLGFSFSTVSRLECGHIQNRIDNVVRAAVWAGLSLVPFIDRSTHD